jgi:hypothetical protein
MAINPIQLIQGEPRKPVKAADAALLRGSGALVEDPRRERPRYFDGRFLSARDLIRDQQYFLTREADLGRAAGSGVAIGLDVGPGSSPNMLRIGAGEGITPAGELVLLPHAMDINLANIPAAEMLSAKFGLSRIPTPPLRSRTGLFVLALRPVEFTANPVGAYPTTLTGPRVVEDGDVIEATAVVLVPWQDDGAADSLYARRGHAARTIFTQDVQAIASANVLPVAMLALQSNTIVWIDEALVRRELGADRADLPGLGFAPRALRMAHLIQHQAHLADAVALSQGRSFPAATQFPALPPAGPLPPGVIDTRDFTQGYFPTEVDVDFSIVPDDELPALVEEALALPPIDFQASAAALDLTAVLIVAPVARADFRAVLAKLNSRTRTLKPAAPNLLAQRKPLEVLQRLRLPLPFTLPDVANPSDAEWARLARLPTLWFVRRRNLAYRDDLVGNGVAATGDDEIALEKAVRDRVLALGLNPQLTSIMTAATSKAAWSVISLLALPAIAASPTLTAAALGALRAKISADPGKRLTNAAALSVGNEIRSGATGTGLVSLESKLAGNVSPAALLHIASNDAWRKLDTSARLATGAQLSLLSERLVAAAPVVVVPEPAVSPAPPLAPVAATPVPAAAQAAAPATPTTTGAAPATAPTTPATPAPAATTTPAAPPTPAPGSDTVIVKPVIANPVTGSPSMVTSAAGRAAAAAPDISKLLSDPASLVATLFPPVESAPAATTEPTAMTEPAAKPDSPARSAAKARADRKAAGKALTPGAKSTEPGKPAAKKPGGGQ